MSPLRARNLIPALIAFGVGALTGAPAASTPDLAGGEPTARAAEPTGRLAIRVRQGTEGGPSRSGGAIELHLFQQNQLIRSLDLTLDEMGLAMVDDLPIDLRLRPLVRVEHSGVVYQEAGPAIEPANPSVSMDVVVYETSREAPAWRVASRQVIIAPSEGKVLVTESVYVNNPADTTWLGEGQTVSEEKLTTVRLGLPAAAANIQLVGGFHGWCCTTLKDDALAVHMPLMPGRAVFEYVYELPASRSPTHLEFASAAPTDELAVIVAETGLTVETDDLVPGSVQMSEHGPMRLYIGHSFPADHRPGIRLAATSPQRASGISSDPNVLPASGTPEGPGMGWLFGGVLALLAVAGVVYAMRRAG